ncbi:hypothetical protein GCM10010327_23050 [Streptomyces nitrosporeus]|nr:hypothetical protein GCM10010327_23050 [Streptomyces nitrosporeus]
MGAPGAAARQLRRGTSGAIAGTVHSGDVTHGTDPVPLYAPWSVRTLMGTAPGSPLPAGEQR